MRLKAILFLGHSTQYDVQSAKADLEEIEIKGMRGLTLERVIVYGKVRRRLLPVAVALEVEQLCRARTDLVLPTPPRAARPRPPGALARPPLAARPLDGRDVRAPVRRPARRVRRARRFVAPRARLQPARAAARQRQRARAAREERGARAARRRHVRRAAGRGERGAGGALARDAGGAPRHARGALSLPPLSSPLLIYLYRRRRT